MCVNCQYLEFGVVGGLVCVGAKLNVVQWRWICALGCTSFNFCEALANFRFCQTVDILSECSNAITDNGPRLGEVRA